MLGRGAARNLHRDQLHRGRVSRTPRFRLLCAAASLFAPLTMADLRRPSWNEGAPAATLQAGTEIQIFQPAEDHVETESTWLVAIQALAD